METTTQPFETWKKATEDYIVRMTQLHDEMGRLEDAAVTRTCSAIEEGTRLLKDAIAVNTSVFAGMREQVIEGVRAATAAATPIVEG